MNEGAVGGDRECGHSGKREEPGTVVPTQVKRTRPYGPLVERDILQQRKADLALRKFLGVIQLLGTSLVRQKLPFILRRVLCPQGGSHHSENDQTAKHVCSKHAH